MYTNVVETGMVTARMLPSLVVASIGACSTPAASPADATPAAPPSAPATPGVSEHEDAPASEDAAEAPRPSIQVAESSAEAGAGARPKEGAAGEARPTGGALCEDGAHRPGDAWKADCNTCRCDDHGKVLCTRMACRKKPAGPPPAP